MGSNITSEDHTFQEIWSGVNKLRGCRLFCDMGEIIRLVMVT